MRQMREDRKTLMKLIRKLKIKLGLYDLRKELARWVKNEFGEQYVEEALDKYDKINRGIPIGGFMETALFLDMVSQVKEDLEHYE